MKPVVLLEVDNSFTSCPICGGVLRRREDPEVYYYCTICEHIFDVREDFLERLLKLQLFIQQTGPEEVRSVELITMDELRFIRKIWLNEKHEFDRHEVRRYIRQGRRTRT